MIAKLSNKNQFTIPIRVLHELGDPRLFEVEVHATRLVLTPVLLQTSASPQAKLAKREPDQKTVAEAVAWAHSGAVR